jgi:hypothetical protein
VAEPQETQVFELSPSGATLTCLRCDTMYDAHAVDPSDECPPVGDGCELCAPQEEIEQFLREQGVA